MNKIFNIINQKHDEFFFSTRTGRESGGVILKSSIRKRTYRAIYRLLDRVSPVPFDCGTICGSACCKPDPGDGSEVGILLMPGEDKIHDKKDPWLSWEELHTDEYELPKSWNGKAFFVKCQTPPVCPRHLRPLQCRSFPLLPHINGKGELSLVYNDYILPYVCPMIEDETELDERFVKAIYTVWKHLIQDPLIYDYVWEDSRIRDRNIK